jgi:hypothetical protein
MTSIEAGSHTVVAEEPRSRFWRNAAIFAGIAVLIYIALYAAAEIHLRNTGEKNRLYMISTAPLEHYDYVILGASHAMPFDFDDANRKLEEATGADIINLSTEGAGILPNRLMLDYFLREHSADKVVYILDSFAFYQSTWNEDRLSDAGLFNRAPFDLDLAWTLWKYPWARPMLGPWISGFTKINNADRFERDLPEMEGKFDNTYNLRVRQDGRLQQLDRQRLEYLYPAEVDQDALARYLAEFEALVEMIQAAGMEMIVVKPPLPPEVIANIPNEAAFDERIGALLAEHGITVHDFTAVTNQAGFFLDTDHLNRAGVTAFNEAHFAPLLRQELGAE